MSAEHESPLQSSYEQIASDLIGRAYDHHKNHARFEETQRSWFLGAYLTLTGLMISGILATFFDHGKPVSGAETFVTLLLILNFMIGACVAFAIMKVTGEFKRHNDRAEAILQYLADHVVEDQKLSDLVMIAKLHTATHDLGKNKITASLSVAAMHNYVMSSLLGFDVALIVYLQHSQFSSTAIVLVWLAVFCAASWLQRTYYEYVERQTTPIPNKSKRSPD